MGCRALRGPQKLFLLWTWEDSGLCSLCFTDLPKEFVCCGRWGIRVEGKPPCSGEGAAEGRVGVRGGLGTLGAGWLCPRASCRSRSGGDHRERAAGSRVQGSRGA